MRFSIAAVTPLLAGANAIIAGIAAPETVAAGKPFNLILRTADYIQSVYDVSFAAGFAHGEGYPDSLGYVLGSYYLGPSESNILTNITRSVTVPAGTPNGEGLITVSVTSLWGAAYMPSLTNYNVSVTIGDETSTTYKSN
ncbi:hypothetical protein ACHAQJ_007265 [Trichoderma viride]